MIPIGASDHFDPRHSTTEQISNIVQPSDFFPPLPPNPRPPTHASTHPHKPFLPPLAPADKATYVTLIQLLRPLASTSFEQSKRQVCQYESRGCVQPCGGLHHAHIGWLPIDFNLVARKRHRYLLRRDTSQPLQTRVQLRQFTEVG